MKPVYRALISIFLILNVIVAPKALLAQDNQWTQFRGSHLDGISGETSAPLVWNDSTHIRWKTEIHGKGWSSPVVFGNQVWVTTATADGKEMSAVAIDLKAGKILFDLPLFHTDQVAPKHDMNSYATPTPCIEKGFVYVHFGSVGTACVSTETGKVVWKREDLKCVHMQGPGSSPMLYKNMLILHYEGTDVQFIVALDKQTGQTIWRTDRPKECYNHMTPVGRKAYITPIVVNVNGKELLISNGSAGCFAYDVMTGKEVWRVIEGDDSSVSMPVSENGTVYFYTSFVVTKDGDKFTDLYAVDPTGSGDVSGSKVVWKIKSPPYQLLTPLVKDGILYTVDAQNNLNVIDVKSGTSLYTKKLKSKHHSSPVYAAGKVYFTSEKGETLIIKASRTLEILGENKLSGRVLATPAVVDHSLLLRTDKALYRIGDQ